jgi:hypothetical protein
MATHRRRHRAPKESRVLRLGPNICSRRTVDSPIAVFMSKRSLLTAVLCTARSSQRVCGPDEFGTRALTPLASRHLGRSDRIALSMMLVQRVREVAVALFLIGSAFLIVEAILVHVHAGLREDAGLDAGEEDPRLECCGEQGYTTKYGRSPPRPTQPCSSTRAAGRGQNLDLPSFGRVNVEPVELQATWTTGQTDVSSVVRSRLPRSLLQSRVSSIAIKLSRRSAAFCPGEPASAVACRVARLSS